MRFYKKTELVDVIREEDAAWIKEKATGAYGSSEEYIGEYLSNDCCGGRGDYYSNGDYWWPDPATPDGLPYIRRDGVTNPHCFSHHRRILRGFRTIVSHLTAGYLLYGQADWGKEAVRRLERFFLDEKTRMNPHLLYAQAIPGVTPGRGIGIIDTLHLIEVPVAADLLESAGVLSSHIGNGLRQWFSEYLNWIRTHPHGLDEMNTPNNHSVCWSLQVAVFAGYTRNEEAMQFVRNRFKEVILSGQMARDGSFPAELGRTKPYGYSIFQLDNLSHLVYVLSDETCDLWEFKLSDGRNLQKGIEYLYPFLQDKSSWPLPPDVEHFEAWPVRQPSLLLAAQAWGEGKYIDLWKKLDKDPADPEIRRNLAMRQPILWFL